MTKKNKDYLTLANERQELNNKAKQDKIALERDKFEYQQTKDKKHSILTIVCVAPILVLVITFVIIWIGILVKQH